MSFRKLVGWLTFLGGVSIILFTLYSSYNIFTGKMKAPELFVLEKKGDLEPTNGGVPDVSAQFEQMITEQLKGLMPVDTLPKLLNLGTWMMLTGVLVFGGSQIANLGVKLIKK